MILILGLITYIVTLIIVESELIRPVREAAPVCFKLDYLVGCYLCCGTWVGFILGLVHPIPGLGFPLSGLAFTALAHLTLVIRDTLERIAS